MRLFHLFNERNNSFSDNTLTNVDPNLIEKSIQLAETVPEHKIIEDVKILKAKYMYNALKLRQESLNQNYLINSN